MFHRRPGRRYRALTSSCRVHGGDASSVPSMTMHCPPDVVVLPLPYELMGGQPYCGASGAFHHRPYFHEDHEVRSLAALACLRFPALTLICPLCCCCRRTGIPLHRHCPTRRPPVAAARALLSVVPLPVTVLQMLASDSAMKLVLSCQSALVSMGLARTCHFL